MPHYLWEVCFLSWFSEVIFVTRTTDLTVHNGLSGMMHLKRTCDEKALQAHSCFWKIVFSTWLFVWFVFYNRSTRKMARKIQRSSGKCCEKHLLMALKMRTRSMKSHLRVYKCGVQHLNAGQGDLRLHHLLCYNFQIIFHTSPLHQAVLSSVFHISLSYLLLWKSTRPCWGL